MSEYNKEEELANLTIRVPVSLLDQLRRVAKRERRSVSQMMRVILEQWIEREGRDDDQP